VVLEKHTDFLRDFRGTPCTRHVRTMQELGLLEDFLRLPQQRIQHLKRPFRHGERAARGVRGLPPSYGFVA